MHNVVRRVRHVRRFVCNLFIGVLGFACLLPVAAAARDVSGQGQDIAPLTMFRDCDLCPEMIALPLGAFEMGAPLEQSAFIASLWTKPKPGQPQGWPHEGPVHRVEIDMPVAMGRNEVTRGEWLACVAAGACSHVPETGFLQLGGGFLHADHPDHPVMNVSFEDIQDYVGWLNAMVGADVYRLPTEAEWEYAARAGTTTPYATGEDLTRDQANISAFRWNGDRREEVPGNPKLPVRVDRMDAANPWGLRHMAGNVLELTLSCATSRHLGLPTSSAYLAIARDVAVCDRTTKGGRFTAAKDYARPASRGKARQTRRSNRLGFRVLRDM